MARKKTKKAMRKTKGKTKAGSRKKRRKMVSAPRKKRQNKRIPNPEFSAEAETYEARGLGANSAGQAGDTQGLPKIPAGGDSDSVEELLEEGQTLEAEIVEGVEYTPDADRSEVKTREVPENDVPEEYLEED